MAAHPEGAPCWVDAMFSDVEGAKNFYGEVLGWTFGESSSDYGNYTQAYANGKAVAAVVPPMPGQEGQSAWCLYFAGMVVLSLVLFAAAPWWVWSAFANLVTPLAAVALFVGEYLLRYRLHPEFERITLARALQAYRDTPLIEARRP